MAEKIDFVVTWVDGSDKNWRKEKALYSPDKDTDDRPERYRDWDLMRYWFRGVEKFAPWVHKVHFVTWGHFPQWLNTENPKLNIVNHKDFIPEKYRPTFNCNPIELNLHRIKGLTEQFVYFNDDFFITGKVKPEDFFIEGKPVDMLAFQPVVANPKNEVMSHLFLNNTLVISRHFNKRENVKKHPGKYFHIGYPPLYFFYNLLELAFPLYTGFYTVHGPYPLCKSIFEEVWEKEYEEMDKTSSYRFRCNNDLTLYLLREWQKLKGDFVPKNIKKHFGYYNVDNNNKKLIDDLKKHRHNIICINDANDKIDFERAKQDLNKAFSDVMPDKSSFER